MKIKKIDPTPNDQAYDRKVIQLACKDFVNYMKTKVKLSYKQSIEDKLEKIALKQHSEFDSFLTVWTGIWVKKWKERVKLVIGNKQTETSKAPEKSELTWQTNQFKEELIDALITTLLNNGEICGTEIMAQHILKQELSKSDVNFDDKKQALTFLGNILHSAHEIAKTSGPLMFVEINKTYYNSIVKL